MVLASPLVCWSASSPFVAASAEGRWLVALEETAETRSGPFLGPKKFPSLSTLSIFEILGCEEHSHVTNPNFCDGLGPGGSKLPTWARELHLATCCGMIWTFLGLKKICNFVRNVNFGR